MNKSVRTTRHARKGGALIVVLGLVMAITVLSLGFLTRSEVEMACGENMALRMQMDQTAASALEHARGLVLNPPDESLAEGYWTGATAQQLDSTSDDFYDVNVAIDASDHCDYDISCEAYRLQNGVKVGRSTLSAQLRLDPSIALWLGTTTALPRGLSITGDVYCAGQLANQATIDGDLFAGIATGSDPTGRVTLAGLGAPLAWPEIGIADYAPSYQIGETSYSPATIATATHPTGTYEPYTNNPAGVRYRNGDAALVGSVNITGLLVVNGDLRVSGSDNTISAVQSFPTLLVSGDLIIEAGGHLIINGLALVEGETHVSADATVTTVTGGLFVDDGFWETTADISGNGLTGNVYGAPIWNPSGGQSAGALQLDGVDDYVDCGNDGAFAIIDRITVAAWVKTNDAGNGEHNPFVTKGDRTYAIKHNAGNTIEFFVYDPVAKWCSATYAVNSSFNDQWHHVAGTYDGSDVKLYIDGILKDTYSQVGTINNQTDHVNIGSNSEEAGRFYDGAIDEVRIYNRVLDPSEILLLHDSPGLAGDTSDLRAWYRFDEAGSTMTLTADPRKTALIIWDWDGATSAWKGQYWSQAAGAFFKSVRRD
jgi:concanavalin A-like lectin/glucanase superfamily protein